jgi:3-isopropylmalate dehydratase small subunit
MRDVIKGKAYVVGDNIDTDMIIPARYLNTMDPNELKLHAMEDLDPERHPVPPFQTAANPGGNGNCLTEFSRTAVF